MSAPLTASQTRAEISRDQWGRPLIESNGRITGYTRASTLAKALDDEYHLTRWKMRMTAIGVAARRDLILAVNAHREDKDRMNDLSEQAMEAAESSARATMGTALHEICDFYDQGKTPYVPEDYRDDVQAYLRATATLAVEVSECFSVCDSIKVAGTPDRVVRLTTQMVTSTGETLPAGTLLITDLKTGDTLNFGHLTYSAQLAVYARSQRYDLSAGRTAMHRGKEILVGDRTDWVPGERVNTSWGLIVHVPCGQGRASLHWVNLDVGWQMANLAVTVREWRKRKDIISGEVLLPVEDFHAVAWAATSVDALGAAYQRAVAAGAWDDSLRSVFTKRRLELEEVNA